MRARARVMHATCSNMGFDILSCLLLLLDTALPVIEASFNDLTNREDIGIVLINQHVANEIRHLLKDYTKTIPTVLEIPSKDSP